MASLPILRLTPAHAAAYRALMLAAYAEVPRTFTATVAERAALPVAWWARRLSEDPAATERVYGAFDGARLAGVAGLRLRTRPATRHKAWLFGLAVRPDCRRQGLGRALVEAVLAAARAVPGTRLIQLTVAETAAPARRLYEACGFRVFGVEPQALDLDGRAVALVHMWRPLDPDEPPGPAPEGGLFAGK